MIDRSIAVLIKCLEEVGGVDLKSLGGRISFQKKTYLIQETGVDLGYRFFWNIYGPYSSELSKVAQMYSEDEEGINNIVRGLNLTEDASEKLKKIKELIQIPEESGLEENKWLELLSSIHFLQKYSYIPGGDKKGVVDKLIMEKPEFKEHPECIKIARKKLEELGFLAA